MGGLRRVLLGALVVGAFAMASCGGGEEKATGFLAVSFVDVQTGWAVRQTGEAESEIVATTDGGETWEKQVKAAKLLTHLDFVDRDHGWAVGEGLLLATSDGGVSWQDLLKESEHAGIATVGIGSVSFVRPEVGWLIDNENHRLEKTTDGGRTWATVDSPLGEHESAIMSFVRPELGWLLVMSGGGAGFQGKVLYRTQDGGDTWVEVTEAMGESDHTPGALGTPGYASEIFFLDEKRGWLTYSSRFGAVVATLDGGRTWRRVPLPKARTHAPTNDLHFLDPDHGWAVTATLEAEFRGQLYKTSDGGQTWSLLATPPD